MKTKLILGLFMALITATQISAGQADGAGGDHKSLDNGSAWFIGTREIRYCFINKSGLADGKVTELINKAFQTWKNYLEGDYSHYQRGMAERAKKAFDKNKILVFNFNSDPLPKCDKNADIKFFIGETPEEAKKAKARYENPMMLVERIGRDDSGWSQGFVWFAPNGTVDRKENLPDWSNEKNFYLALLHEMGHILGCDHIPSTIMDENITFLLYMNQLSKDNKIKPEDGINMANDVYHCDFDCLSLNIERVEKLPNFMAQRLEDVIGRKTEGDVWATLYAKDQREMNLKIRDNKGTEHLKIQLAFNDGITVKSLFAFKTVVPNTDRFSFNISFARSLNGKIYKVKDFNAKEGVEVGNVIYGRNTGNAPLTLQFEKKNAVYRFGERTNHWTTIFESKMQ